MSGISKRLYLRTTGREWKGRKVRALQDVNTKIIRLPAGTVFTITGKASGFDLLSEACSCCGAQIRISKAHPESFELLPPADLLESNDA